VPAPPFPWLSHYGGAVITSEKTADASLGLAFIRNLPPKIDLAALSPSGLKRLCTRPEIEKAGHLNKQPAYVLSMKLCAVKP
jgi:hypothetical protein